MNTEILKAYRESIEVNAKKDGVTPRAMTANDERIAVIAATYSEADLRHAVVMRAAFARKNLAEARAKAVEPAQQVEA